MKKLLILIAVLVVVGISCNSTITRKKPSYPKQTKSYTPVDKVDGDMPFYIYVFQVDGHEYISDNRGGLIHKVNCHADHDK